MYLVIVESPAKATTIGKYLGKEYSVVSSFGHVRDIPSREGAVVPSQDFAIDYEINPAAQKHVKQIVENAKKADKILVASDPDREGEAIAWHIAEILKARRVLKKDCKIQRIVFQEITKSAVTDALKHPRDINYDLVDAQQARRVLDYLVGFTLSPILWRKLPGSRSAGRVQSVALRMICDRESEIEAFVSQEYWTIDCKFEGAKRESFIAHLQVLKGNKLDKFDIPSKEQSDKICSALLPLKYSVKSVEKKQQTRNPYPPFITSTLQQEASRKLGFSAKKTMQLAQRLYEGTNINGDNVALITYMRTDGVKLATEAITQIRKYISQTFGDTYLPKNPRIYKTKVRNAQEAHEAIRPIDIFLTSASLRGKLDEDQWRLYDLIWKRSLACQMNGVVFDQVHVLVVSDDGYAELKATGSVIAFDGFYKVYGDQKEAKDSGDDGRILPILVQGERLNLLDVLPEQHFTEPPPRYSEASLVKHLEELGIGRPSTYASIISVLQDRGYVRLETKRFIPEERGRVVTAFLVSFFKKYVEYDFTANLEHELDLISSGEMEWKAFLRNFWNAFQPESESVKECDREKILEAVGEILEKHVFASTDEGNSDNRKCPGCAEGVLKIKISRFGPFVGCSRYPECKYTRALEGGKLEAGEPDDKALGTDPQTDKTVLLKHGPYGFYLQLDEGANSKKAKKYSVPKGLDVAKLNLEYALKLMQLPREVCKHPVTGMPIKAGIGRFGPYLLYNGLYSRLHEIDQIFNILPEEAVQLVDQTPKSAGRILGQYKGKDVSLHKGRFGLYIKFDGKNIKAPKDIDIETISYDEVIALTRCSNF
jgi:DNA topoisomerase-1